jgi:hypothetical protein
MLKATKLKLMELEGMDFRVYTPCSLGAKIRVLMLKVLVHMLNGLGSFAGGISSGTIALAAGA